MKKIISVLTAFVLMFLLIPSFSTAEAASAVSKGIAPQPFNRYYCAFSNQHYYSTGPTIAGYYQEGVEGYVLPVQLPNTIPLYLCRAFYTDLYTTNYDEYANLVNNSWSQDLGIVGYVKAANSGAINTTPMYRWYNPALGDSDAFADHFYTISTASAAIHGYGYEGVGFDVWKTGDELAYLSLQSPLGGETLTAGKTVNITWQGSANIGTINVYYSTDGGDTWIQAGQTANTGSYAWTVPNSAVSNFCRVKLEWPVTDANGTTVSMVYSYSGADFKIAKGSNAIIGIIPINPILTIKIPFITPPTLLTGSFDKTNVNLSWSDNATNETGYSVERRTKDSTVNIYTVLATLPANSKSYTDTAFIKGTEYLYRVRATGALSNSTYTNTVDVKTQTYSRINTLAAKPSAPTGLNAAAASSTAVNLKWGYGTGTITGFKVERKEGAGSFAQIAVIPAGTVTYADTGLKVSTLYTYRVLAYNANNSDASNEATATTNGSKDMVLVFTLGSSTYTENGMPRQMDVQAVAQNGRVLLPVKYICETIGAAYPWNDVEKSVTITKGSTVMKLVLNGNTAIVNGVPMLIDPGNLAVTPVAVPPGRIFMPFRFICEKLGGTVSWDQNLQQATATFPSGI